MSDYWLGVATLPVLFVAVCVVSSVFTSTVEFLGKRLGISFEWQFKRQEPLPDDYTLRHNIWWERSWGPFFGGGWYRDHGWPYRLHRWFGIGPANGPSFIVYKKSLPTQSPTE